MVLYDSRTGALFYDADGTGAEAATQIAKVYYSGRPVINLSAADFIVI
jgi:hypothetical protein